MNAFNVDVSSQSQSSSTNLPNSALRTRNRRLVNIVGEDSGDEASVRYVDSHNETQYLSPYGSRAPSPIPNKHPSRSSSLNPSQPRSQTLGRNWTQSHTSSALQNDLTTQFNGLLGNSWTALQGLASTVLGSDASSGNVKDNTIQRRRRPREATHSPVRGGIGSAKWGPSAPAGPRLGAGTQEERQAMVRAKKREELLLANGSAFLDSAAIYKRRNSDDFESMSAPPAEGDLRDTLVYIHHVQPEDTLAGISIKFGCSLATLKSSNGMWTNDSIMSRKAIVVPVNECSVKGRRIESPDTDLLLENDLPPQEPTSHWRLHRRDSASTIKAPTNPLPPTKSPQAKSMSPISQSATLAWTHDSWIQLDNHPTAIEIARLPRRELGFFPRARRKSTCPSDLSPSEIPRLSLDHDHDRTHQTRPPGRPRASSKTTTQAHFAALMQGPGGVGRLVGKSPVRGPGPAEDKLNKLFAAHLPNLAPPVTPTSAPGFAFDSGTGYRAAPFANALGSPSPRRSMDSNFSGTTGGGGGGSNLEHVGGAIEGWMRKVATRAARMVEPGSPMLSPHAAGASGAGAGGGPGAGVGDLIELSDTSELGDGEHDVVSVDGERRGTRRAWDAWDAAQADFQPAGWERGRSRLNGVEQSGSWDQDGLTKRKGD